MSHFDGIDSVPNVKLTCYACGQEPADDEWSDEHIIHNALGGRWRSRRLLCRSCNSDLGNVIDAALCRELGMPMNVLGLPRQRGEVPRQVVRLASGEEYLRDAEGNLRLRYPVISEVRSDGEMTINIQGSDMRQLKKALEGLARKYPSKIDVDQWMSMFNDNPRFHMGPTVFAVRGAGSDEALRAVTKIAAGAFICGGGTRDQILPCIEYIKGAVPGTYGRWFYAADILSNRGPDAITHVVAVRAKAGAPLWAYVELFRVFRFAVRLSELYTGPTVRVDYVFDLIEGSALAVRSLQLDFDDVDFNEGGLDVEALKEQLEILRRVAEQRSQKAAISGAVDRAFERVFAEKPEATAQDLWPHLWKELEPILVAWVGGQRAPRKD